MPYGALVEVSMHGVLTRKKTFRYRDRHAQEEGHVTSEAEAGGIHVRPWNTKGCWHHRKLEEAVTVFLQSFQRAWGPADTSDFGLVIWDNIFLFFFCHLIGSLLLGQP